MDNSRPTIAFCPRCGAPLPPGNPRFCIECGYPVAAQPEGTPPAPSPSSVGQMTVRLPNARVVQSVIGGTVKLPSSGAVPPGMWVLDEPPSAQTVVAIYAPLRAIVGGWSGLSGQGWRRDERQALAGSRMLFTFLAERVWFPAPGCGGGLQLHVTIAAIAESEEGRERIGFRYCIGDDPPMEVRYAEWRTSDGHPVPNQPLPAIQIMAPPRIPRVSDLNETIRRMSRSEADRWLVGSVTQGVYQLLGGDIQQRTPAGRGLLLVEVVEEEQCNWLQRLFVVTPARYRVRIERPLTVDLTAWNRQVKQIRQEAAALGLDVATDAAIEWWIDRYGYDGVIFTGADQRYRCNQVIVAFRRGQVVRV
ncbi:MAG: zinc ribbon domain-containing protein [Chloroflexus sp.]|uniref:zinc ribbon domain-containing protein n=1 Tax=Chloroflexus sp. TaxID=1904827 RepID=UPI0021DC29BF|nr:zinc ribbon domain-containing protein [Chloroflexus sp.]GIV89712.1 MAG: zinc ribbon domain-containing protein [Chloroflexus sp.]